MNFSSNLKALRKSRGMTQEQLADFLNLSRSTIAGYESRNRQPDFEHLVIIAEFFHVTIDYLLRGYEDEPDDSIKENILDQEVLRSYRKLTFDSKQDALRCIRLLELRDSTKK